MRDSIDSIRQDDTVVDKYTAVLSSLTQFATYLQDNEVIKAGKKISGERMGKLKDLHSQLGELIAGADDDPDNSSGDEGVQKVKGSAAKVPTDDLTKAKSKFPDGHPEGCMCDTCKGIRDDVAKSANVTKGMPEDFVKKYQSLEKRYSDLEAELKKRDEAAKEESIKKDVAGLSLGVNVDDVMPVLKSLYGTEGYDKMVSTLTAASEQVKKGKLFAEVGHDGVIESDVKKQIDAVTTEIQKNEAGLTYEQAFQKALEKNPQLYTEYMAERRGK